MSDQHHEPMFHGDLSAQATALFEQSRREYERERMGAMVRHPSFRARFNQVAFDLVTDGGKAVQ